MSEEYDNTNTGVLFTNRNKTRDQQPDWRGSIDIAGTKYWLSGWERAHDKYGTYISVGIGDEVSDNKRVKEVVRHGPKPRK